jgi:hypothetical protein
MKGIFIFIAAFFSVLLIQALPAMAQTSTYHRYIIEFSDKKDSPYSVSSPEEFLSPRSIDRRQRFGIPITETDLPVNPAYVQALQNAGAKVLNRSKWLNSVSIHTEDSLVLAAIDELPFVKEVSAAGFRMSGESLIQKNKFPQPIHEWKTSESERYPLETFGTAAHQIQMLEGNVLHEKGFRGEGMWVALLDGGWYNTPLLDVFDSLYMDGRLLGVWNFVSGNDTVYSFSTHGTTVLSAMAANQPGKMIGTAPGVSVFLFVTEDVFSESPIEEHNWAAGAEMADSLGVDIISSSLGYSLFDDPAFNYSYADMNGKTTMISRAATIASRTGMIVSTSAGNSGLQPWFYITAPADADSVLSIGATDSTGTFTGFSSHGPSADGRVKPDVMAQGIRVWVVDPSVENNTTFPGNGTSFANPIIAGLAACLWQANPEKNNFEIIDAIRRSAHLYRSPNDSMGYGIPNFQLADLLLKGEAPAQPEPQPALLYPNPFNESFGILYYENSSEWQPVTLEIFDIAGRKLHSLQGTLQTGYNYLPVSQLADAANGAYFIRFNRQDGSEIFRVVKAE